MNLEAFETSARKYFRQRAWMVGLLTCGALALSALSVRADDDPTDPEEEGGDWLSYNHDSKGSRYNSAENTLRASNVSGLQVKWQFPTPAPVTGTPVVANNLVYAGDMSGQFYALGRNGNLLWSRQLAGAVTASALITDQAIIVGTISGTLYGLKPTTGAVLWSMRPDAHPVAGLWGSPIKVGRYVAVPVGSNEEQAATTAGYVCCSTRGSVVLLDPKNGSVVWTTPTITDAQRAAGSSGASIWSTPTYDAASGQIFVSTGNNFSQPTTGTSDALIALDAKTGAIRWVNQRTANDEWNYRFPISDAHPDFDFGDSPQIYRLPGGRKVVGAGQKSGFFHVVDATTGALVNQAQFEYAGPLGGLFADSAVANGVVFANGNNWPQPGAGAPSGDLVAFSGDATHELWRFQAPGLIFGGVAVANSVVYFTSVYFTPTGPAGVLYALNSANGSTLAAIPVGSTNASNSGPSVSRGRVYVGTGNALGAVFGTGVTAGSITALGL